MMMMFYVIAEHIVNPEYPHKTAKDKKKIKKNLCTLGDFVEY
jgi:hypothetical protein